MRSRGLLHSAAVLHKMAGPVQRWCRTTYITAWMATAPRALQAPPTALIVRKRRYRAMGRDSLRLTGLESKCMDLPLLMVGSCMGTPQAWPASFWPAGLLSVLDVSEVRASLSPAGSPRLARIRCNF